MRIIAIWRVNTHANCRRLLAACNISILFNITEISIVSTPKLDLASTDEISSDASEYFLKHFEFILGNKIKQKKKQRKKKIRQDRSSASDEESSRAATVERRSACHWLETFHLHQHLFIYPTPSSHFLAHHLFTNSYPFSFSSSSVSISYLHV